MAEWTLVLWSLEYAWQLVNSLNFTPCMTTQRKSWSSGMLITRGCFIWCLSWSPLSMDIIWTEASSDGHWHASRHCIGITPVFKLYQTLCAEILQGFNVGSKEKTTRLGDVISGLPESRPQNTLFSFKRNYLISNAKGGKLGNWLGVRQSIVAPLVSSIRRSTAHSTVAP